MTSHFLRSAQQDEVTVTQLISLGVESLPRGVPDKIFLNLIKIDQWHFSQKRGRWTGSAGKVREGPGGMAVKGVGRGQGGEGPWGGGMDSARWWLRWDGQEERYYEVYNTLNYI